MTRGPIVRPLPLARAILWRPESAPAAARPTGAPVFIDQNALTALRDHYAASSQQGVLGFLVGDLCRDPAGTPYVVVDSTIRLNQALYGDKTGVVVGKLWDRIQNEIAKIEGQLIGWYHSHPPHGVGLSPGDVETHLMYFTQPWQIALVLAAESRGSAAGLFRPGRGAGSVTAELAFYELLPEGASKTDTAPSIMSWVNYETDAKVARAGPTDAPATSPAATGLRPTLQTLRPLAHKRTPAEPPQAREPSQPPEPPKPSKQTQPPRPSLPKLRPPKLPPKPTAKAKPPDPAGLDPALLADLLPPPPPRQASPPPPRRTSGAPPRQRPSAPTPAPSDLEIERASEPPAAAEPPPSRPTAQRPQRPAPKPPPPPVADAPLPPPPPPPAERTREEAPPETRRQDRAPPPEAMADLPLLHVEEPAATSPPLAPDAFEVDDLAPRARPVAQPSAPPRAPSREPVGEPEPFEEVEQVRLRLPWRAVALGVLGVGALAAGVWFSGLLRRESPPAPAPARVETARPTTPAVDPRLVALDRLGDTLSRAVGAYRDRARLFDNRQMTCADLARALVAVEDRWITYNADGRARAPGLDIDRTRRDEGLYAAVDSVDRHFERSGCARP